MTKNFNIALVTLALLVFLPANFARGQFIPNAPFKAASVNAPDFSLKDLQDNVFKLSKQRGKHVLIFFWHYLVPFLPHRVAFL